jgi:hypothetical protein
MPRLSDPPPTRTPELSDDLLEGGKAIGNFVYGPDDPGAEKKAHHLAATKAIPAFKLGAKVCSRKSVLLAWIARQEAAAK